MPVQIGPQITGEVVFGHFVVNGLYSAATLNLIIQKSNKISSFNKSDMYSFTMKCIKCINASALRENYLRKRLV